MNGFYKHKKNMNDHNQIEKRHKMLQKIQADKERTIDLKQQDIFYITKYANKFNIDTKKLLQWHQVSEVRYGMFKKRGKIDKRIFEHH